MNLIIINGHMGAGKSRLAKLLAEKLPDKTFHLEIDDIKRMFGKYNQDKSSNLQIAYDISGAIIEKCLKSNLTVIVDKAMNDEEVMVYESIATANGVKTIKLFLDINFETQVKRIIQRQIEKGNTPLTEEEIERLKEKFKSR